MAGLQTDDAALAGLAESKKDDYVLEKKDFQSDGESSVVPYDDVLYAGCEFPTKEEEATLPRESDTLPWNAYSEYLVV